MGVQVINPLAPTNLLEYAGRPNPLSTLLATTIPSVAAASRRSRVRLAPALGRFQIRVRSPNLRDPFRILSGISALDVIFTKSSQLLGIVPEVGRFAVDADKNKSRPCGAQKDTALPPKCG